MEPITTRPVGPVPRPTTIYDIAREAGVSHQTVSRFIRGHTGIRPATREKVARAVEALSYRPNLTARSLTTGQSHRIGALTHELGQVGPSQIVQGASAGAREAGYLLDIVTLDVSDIDAIRSSVNLLMQHDLAGIIALVSTDEMRQAFEATLFGIPAVIAGEADEVTDGAFSELTAVGIPLLLSHLADMGHTRVLHLTGPQTWSAARNRTRAFLASADSTGITATSIVEGDWSARSGYEAVRAYTAEGRAYTAIVAANDQMAIGAIHALHEAGLSVPRDVSVTGMDDIPEAAYLTPPLTTLALDFENEGRRAIDQLLAHMGRSSPPTEVGLRSQLILRSSTSPPARRQTSQGEARASEKRPTRPDRTASFGLS